MTLLCPLGYNYNKLGFLFLWYPTENLHTPDQAYIIYKFILFAEVSPWMLCLYAYGDPVQQNVSTHHRNIHIINIYYVFVCTEQMSTQRRHKLFNVPLYQKKCKLNVHHTSNVNIPIYIIHPYLLYQNNKNKT